MEPPSSGTAISAHLQVRRQRLSERDCRPAAHRSAMAALPVALSASRPVAHSVGAGGTLKLLELARVMGTAVRLTLHSEAAFQKSSQWPLPKASHGELPRALLARPQRHRTNPRQRN